MAEPVKVQRYDVVTVFAYGKGNVGAMEPSEDGPVAYYADVDPFLAELAELREWKQKLTTPRPISEWHEDMGAVLSWSREHGEPPFCGWPTEDEWPDLAGHFTPCPNPIWPEVTP